MSKFNLKDYQKTNGDQHITMRLKEQHGKESDVLNQKQLDSYRVNEDKNVTIQKLLEDKRLGESDEITEKSLDTHKAQFENKYRNSSAYEGDINKLEEKRLKGETMEGEKYEAAAETPKSFRWWEGVKSPDGLKVASKTIKTAQEEDVLESLIGTEDDEPTEEEATNFIMKEEPYVGHEPKEESLFDDEGDDFPIEGTEKESPLATYGQMYVVKQKDLTNAKTPEANGVYMVLAYDPSQFKGDQQRIKDAAYQRVLQVRPELENLISPDDFGSIEESSVGGIIKMRALGTPFYKFFSDKGEFGSTPSSASPSASTTPSLPEEEGLFSEISYKEKDIGGTPMAIGRVVTDSPITPENRDAVLRDAISFITKKHPGIKVDSESLDLSNISKGEIEFMVSVPLAGAEKEKTLDEEFAEMEAETPDLEMPELAPSETDPSTKSWFEGDYPSPESEVIDMEETPPALTKPNVANADFEIKEAQSDTKKKVDKKRIEKAYDSFFRTFDADDLKKANQELQDLINVAQLTPAETLLFLSKVKKQLTSRNIFLDFLSTNFV